LAKTFSVAFSQARYVNRIYGIPDGFDGLLHDIPANTPANRLERLLKIIIYACGGVVFHALENSALIMYIIRRCDPEKIPKTKAWLVKRGPSPRCISSPLLPPNCISADNPDSSAGLWDIGDNLDALAQVSPSRT
jgi:hypothetical protein